MAGAWKVQWRRLVWLGIAVTLVAVAAVATTQLDGQPTGSSRELTAGSHAGRGAAGEPADLAPLPYVVAAPDDASLAAGTKTSTKATTVATAKAAAAGTTATTTTGSGSGSQGSSDHGSEPTFAPDAAGSAPPPPPTTEPRQPGDPDTRDERIEAVPLSLAIVDYQGARLQVQARARSGCSRLKGTVSGAGSDTVRVDVDGMSYPTSGVCTADAPLRWIDLGAVREGATTVIVHTQGREARHTLVREGQRFTAQGHGDTGAAPFESDTWWEVPADILSVHAWYGSDGASQRVADRVEQQLALHHTLRFQRPAGDPVLPRTDGSRDPNAWSDRTIENSVVRVYRGSVTDDELRAIFERALAGERCVYLMANRRDEYNRTGRVMAGAPC